jgi:hypothetical protein
MAEATGPELLAREMAQAVAAGPVTVAAIVRPGDALVVGFGQNLTRETAEAIKEELGRKLPGVLIVIAAGVAPGSMAVYRPGPAAVPEDDMRGAGAEYE